MVLLTAVVLAAAVGVVVSAVLLRLPQSDLSATRAVREELGRSPRVRRFIRTRMTPGRATGLALTAAMLAVVVTGVLFGVIVYMIRRNSGMVGWDLRVASWAGDRGTSRSTRVLELITDLGSTVAIVLVSVATAIYGYRRWHRSSVVLYLTLVVAGQSVIANVIKAAVTRARPAIRPLASYSGASFPSGHTTAAAATFAALALVLGRGKSAKVRAVLGGVAAAIAVAVGCSRMFLGVHWLSDVVAGLALGWSWFAISTVAFGGRILHFGAPAEVAAAPTAPSADVKG